MSAGQALQTAEILLNYTGPLGPALVQPIPALIPFGRDYYEEVYLKFITKCKGIGTALREEISLKNISVSHGMRK